MFDCSVHLYRYRYVKGPLQARWPRRDRLAAVSPKKKLPAAVELGRRGGLAAAGAGARVRYAAMTREERVALAKKAISARWAKKKTTSR
jgi:hypothetical protein